MKVGFVALAVKRSNAVYLTAMRNNKGLDRDKDGIAMTWSKHRQETPQMWHGPDAYAARATSLNDARRMLLDEMRNDVAPDGTETFGCRMKNRATTG